MLSAKLLFFNFIVVYIIIPIVSECGIENNSIFNSASAKKHNHDNTDVYRVNKK